MRVLEGFCRLVVGLDVEDRVSLKSIPFANTVFIRLTALGAY